MSLDSFVLSLIEDPADHQVLLYVESDSVLYNPRTRVAYPVKGSIPVLLETETRPATEDEHQRWTQPGIGRATGSPSAS